MRVLFALPGRPVAPRPRRLALVVALAAAGLPGLAGRAAAQGRPAELRWGGDPEGGSPYIEADPADPSRVVGFDVDIAGLLARGLGRTPRFVPVSFVAIDQSVARGDFDIGLNGIEETPARRARFAVTVPYYEFTEVLTVRAGDRARYRTLADLTDRRVGTLGTTIAYDLLLDAQRRHRVEPVSYDDDVHPYSDLALGRLDAVLLDDVLAAKATRRDQTLVTQPAAVAIGHYVGLLARENAALRDQVDRLLLAAMRDGSLEAILRRSGVWNDAQARLHARLLGRAPAQDRAAEAPPRGAAPGPAPVQGAAPPTRAERSPSEPVLEASWRYAPALLRAALVTLVLSCLAMGVAVGVGVLVASGRVYGTRATRLLLAGYVELTRGTPILLQLFVLYYGLAAVVRMPAFLAALVGLALNYAAYESEIYRGALEAVPRGQLEAARALGLTERQVLMLVRGPQAFRLALAPMTNDFVALLKDSSLVSVLTVVELTKQTSIFAANVGSWVVPGALCAALYLAMSLPLSRLARRLERQWKAPGR